MKIKVKPIHIDSQWSEMSTGDGYWILLKRGWKVAGDDVHAIHESTKSKAFKQMVEPCHCADCK